MKRILGAIAQHPTATCNLASPTPLTAATGCPALPEGIAAMIKSGLRAMP